MRRPQRHNLLFRAACEGLKLLAFMVVGFVSICLFWASFGSVEQAATLMQIAIPFFLRLTIALVSLFAMAGLIESLD
jgi:hypothetical protein